ncbi:MAG TPA: DNRLRE domain-containing protein [Solirubrobacterales bacterium]|nr:DNRLRE domain-containing protein [Solirubrobacterales bacterium]
MLTAFPGHARALTLPPGFQQSTAIAGLNDPMDAEVAPNGRVFVAEKGGTIQTFDDLADPSPTTFADLRTQVHNFSSRGLLGLAIDPAYPAEPYVYVYYTLDAPIGGTAPTFGNPGQTVDQCPGDTDEVNCIVSQRVSRLRVAGEQQDGPEQVLVNDWCQQFQYHPGGGIEFGADGYLYVSGGDGARWEIFDYGQLGNPMNPCGDPPSPVGGPMSPPTAEGGRLRAQDLRTPGDPLGLNGSLIRIDPATGEGAPGNPMSASPEPNARRMLAHGFRNPVRLAIRPGTNDAWVADRGGGYWEELDRVPDPSDPVRNFGWPCYEGGLDANGVPYARIRPRSNDQDLNICEDLYAAGSATAAPYWGYDHEAPVVPGEDCEEDPGSGEPAGNQIGGLNFYPAAGSFPAAYRNALFFADRLRNCMWAMLPGPDGVPDRGRVIPFGQQLPRAIDIEVGPDGDLLYVDQAAEAVQRIEWNGNASNQAPTADAQADTITGNSPLTVTFDAGGSSDPDSGDLLIYEWDLDGDGQFGDSTAAAPTHTYLEGGTYTVTLRVTDTSGATATDTVTITVGGGPVGSIDTPAAGTTWATGEVISFSGSATDAGGGSLPASALDWDVVLVRCTTPGDCQETPLASVPDAAGGSFTAPDADLPAHIEIRLTATDSGGETETRTRRIDPRTADLTLSSTPAGATVSADGVTGTAPLTRPAIVASSVTISAAAQHVSGETTQRFSSWSDGQPQTHDITMPAGNTSRTARYAPHAPGGTTLAFLAAADAMVQQSSPTTNSGTFDQLRTDNSPVEQSYLRFVVGGVAGKVTSAKLRLRSAGETVDGPELRGTGNAWTENGITWQNRPAATTGVIADTGPIAQGEWIEWDVTSLVQADGTYNFQLANTSDDGVAFRSREFSNVPLRPELVVAVTNDAYPRPRSATGVRVSLVPAFTQCTQPNRVHGPPLAHPSCAPPAAQSPALTVGTPDANGYSANSTGVAQLKARPGDPATPADDADVTVTLQLTDVREASGLHTDYTGNLQLRPTLRLTDRESAAAGTTTVQDFPLPVTVPCAVTLSPASGSDCAVATTFDAVTPGIVDEGARGVWQLAAIDVLDGGPDGDVSTPGNTVFATSGLFVP